MAKNKKKACPTRGCSNRIGLTSKLCRSCNAKKNFGHAMPSESPPKRRTSRKGSSTRKNPSTPDKPTRKRPSGVPIGGDGVAACDRHSAWLVTARKGARWVKNAIFRRKTDAKRYIEALPGGLVVHLSQVQEVYQDQQG